MLCIHCKNILAKFAVVCLATSSLQAIHAQSPRLVTLPVASANRGNAVVEAYLAETVDVQPSFPGGDGAMMRFINAERRYPRDAYDANVQGRVVCGFVVAPDGSISNIDIVRGVERSLNQEAIRIIKAMPTWNAGMIDGERVPVYCLLPIPFRR